jgi:shikimate kinase
VAQFQRQVKRPDEQSPKTCKPMATPSHPAPDLPIDRTIVLIGMMGAGKSAVGRRLASVLGLPFQDADAAIEAAAGASISDIFAEIGEAAFREKERRVIARLLSGEKQVLALGGGAFMDPETRGLVRARALSIWLSAGLDALVRRTARRGSRPLLAKGDPAATLAQLLEQRGPVYAQADIVVDSGTGPLNAVVARVLDALARHLHGATN